MAKNSPEWVKDSREGLVPRYATTVFIIDALEHLEPPRLPALELGSAVLKQVADGLGSQYNESFAQMSFDSSLADLRGRGIVTIGAGKDSPVTLDRAKAAAFLGE